MAHHNFAIVVLKVPPCPLRAFAGEGWLHSQKKRYKSCHWSCTFSKGKILYPKAAYWYLSGTY